VPAGHLDCCKENPASRFIVRGRRSRRTPRRTTRIVIDASAALEAVLPGPRAGAVLARRHACAVLTLDRRFARILANIKFAGSCLRLGCDRYLGA